jgi:hypothetical protein
LSEFAEYVEKQQAMRYPASKLRNPIVPKTVSESAQPADEHHAELDELFDSLDLQDTAPVCLRELLLPPLDVDRDTALGELRAILAERIEDGSGETVFDLGFENTGESMGLSRTEWDVAYARLEDAARAEGALCKLLLTLNVGGDVEAESAQAQSKANSKKPRFCSGKVMVRRIPQSNEQVIETRIVVVGNGTSLPIFM